MGTPRKSSPASRAKAPSKLLAPPVPVVNVETIGKKIKVYSLENLLANKRNFKIREPAKLVDVLQPWYEKTIEKPGKKIGHLDELWLQLIPAAIAQHSKILSYSRSTLTVSVPSAPLRAQLETLLRQGTLKQLQALSKGSIFRVKTIVDGSNEP
jgi:hypothetical protein